MPDEPARRDAAAASADPPVPAVASADPLGPAAAAAPPPGARPATRAAKAGGSARASGFGRALWRALPGDLLGRSIVRLAGARVTRVVDVEGIGRVDLVEDPRLGRWLDRVSRTPTAMTFGRVVVARRRLDEALVRHEAEHVRQWGVLGPLFLPTYLAASVVARARGADRYRGNALEAAAFAAEAGPRAVTVVCEYDTDRPSGSLRA